MADATPNVRDRSHAAQLLKRLGRLRAERAQIEQEMAEAVAAAEQKPKERIQKRDEQIDAIEAELTAWAEAGKADLVKPGTKTIDLPTGTISFRTGQPKIVVRDHEAACRQAIAEDLAHLVKTKRTLLTTAPAREHINVLRHFPSVEVTEARDTVSIKPTAAA